MEVMFKSLSPVSVSVSSPFTTLLFSLSLLTSFSLSTLTFLCVLPRCSFSPLLSLFPFAL